MCFSNTQNWTLMVDGRACKCSCIHLLQLDFVAQCGPEIHSISHQLHTNLNFSDYISRRTVSKVSVTTLYWAYGCGFCRVRVYLDDVLEGEASHKINRMGQNEGSLYLGGTESAGGIANLTGCLSNIFVKRWGNDGQVVNMGRTDVATEWVCSKCWKN